MATNVLFPSLSEDGWVTSSVKIADYLLSHFFASDYSQTYLYHPSVSSMAYILQETQGDVLASCLTMRDTITQYLNRYFTNVVVEATDGTLDTDPSKGIINLYVKFTDSDGVSYSLGKLLRLSNMRVTEIIDINNG